MDIAEDIVIVGAGVAGLAASLGVHRLGLRSLVLEWSDSLRTTGSALTLLTNAWRALDALGVGDRLRERSVQLQGANHEGRCAKRKELLQTLEKELQEGIIKYSSRVVSIEESGHLKLLHLAAGCLIKTKVLIGCDGVKSVVAKFLGLQKPIDTGRFAIRGFVDYPEGHQLKAMAQVYFVMTKAGTAFALFIHLIPIVSQSA